MCTRSAACSNDATYAGSVRPVAISAWMRSPISASCMTNASPLLQKRIEGAMIELA